MTRAAKFLLAKLPKAERLGAFCIQALRVCTLAGLCWSQCSFEARAASAPERGMAPSGGELKGVKVFTKKEGDLTHFFVQNNELSEVTMTFEMGLENLRGATKFPYTATFPGRQTTEAFTLSPVEADEKWGYSYTNYYKLGSNCAQHDDSVLYQLPYAQGKKFKVTQGYYGSFSHRGSNLYAIDWQMPEGTPVYAARGGLVVKLKDDSNSGGSSMKYDPFNNYVLIRHADGTLGHYCHLQKGGATVKPGEIVQAGQLIAHSGNTGFSSGPHLHFSVYRTRDGRERESLPVKFKTGDANGTTLVTGRSYRAAAAETTIVAAPAPIIQGVGASNGGS